MKKIAAFMISIMMVWTLLPAFVFAEDDGVRVSTKDEFIEAAQNDAVKKINVTANIDMTDAGVLDVSGCTIDLGGNTVSAKNFSLIFQGSDFTIRNGKFDSKGGSYALFIGEDPTDNVVVENVTMSGGINVYNSTNVVLRNVNIKAVDYYAVWCDQNGKVTIESGTFETSEKSTALIGMSSTDSSLNIQGGDFRAGDQPLVLQGDFNRPVVQGGSFDCSAKDYVDEQLKFEVSTDGVYQYYTTIEEAMQNSTENSNIAPTDKEIPEGAAAVTLVFNDGTEKKVRILADKEGKVTLPDVQKISANKEKFLGWRDGDKLYKAGTTIIVESDKELVGEWETYEVKHVEAKAPTCTENGNIEYWYLSELGKYFKDEALTQEIKLQDTIISATGHKFENGVCTLCGAKDPDYEAEKPMAAPNENGKEPDDQIKSPKTGDQTNIILWGKLALISAGVSMIVLLTKRRKVQN